MVMIGMGPIDQGGGEILLHFDGSKRSRDSCCTEEALARVKKNPVVYNGMEFILARGHIVQSRQEAGTRCVHKCQRLK